MIIYNKLLFFGAAISLFAAQATQPTMVIQNTSQQVLTYSSRSEQIAQIAPGESRELPIFNSARLVGLGVSFNLRSEEGLLHITTSIGSRHGSSNFSARLSHLAGSQLIFDGTSDVRRELLA